MRKFLEDARNTSLNCITTRKRNRKGKDSINKISRIEDSKPNYIEQLLPSDQAVKDSVQPDVEALIKPPSVPSKSDIVNVHGSFPTRLKSTISNMHPIDILHRRMGHSDPKAIQRAIKFNALIGAHYTYEQIRGAKLLPCLDCQRGRMVTNKSVWQTTGTEYGTLEKIGIDWKGPFPVRIFGGNRGFFLLVDHKSGFGAAYLCKNKSSSTLLQVLQKFNNTVVKFYGRRWKFIQCDSERILTDELPTNWLTEQSILQHISAPYTHWQNTLPERYIGTIMNMARTLMVVYSAPAFFWGFAVLNAVYINNRTVREGRTKTPYEEVTQHKPDISNFVPFYAPISLLLNDRILLVQKLKNVVCWDIRKLAKMAI